MLHYAEWAVKSLFYFTFNTSWVVYAVIDLLDIYFLPYLPEHNVCLH